MYMYMHVNMYMYVYACMHIATGGDRGVRGQGRRAVDQVYPGESISKAISLDIHLYTNTISLYICLYLHFYRYILYMYEYNSTYI